MKLWKAIDIELEIDRFDILSEFGALKADIWWSYKSLNFNLTNKHLWIVIAF